MKKRREEKKEEAKREMIDNWGFAPSKPQCGMSWQSKFGLSGHIAAADAALDFGFPHFPRKTERAVFRGNRW